jgi:hypothetical protein
MFRVIDFGGFKINRRNVKNKTNRPIVINFSVTVKAEQHNLLVMNKLKVVEPRLQAKNTNTGLIRNP